VRGQGCPGLRIDGRYGVKVMYGRNHLRQAAALFDGPDGYVPCPSALTSVFGHVWAAVAMSHRWPSGDRADLAWLIAASRRYGSCADTAWRMSIDEILEFRAELNRIAR